MHKRVKYSLSFDGHNPLSFQQKSYPIPRQLNTLPNLFGIENSFQRNYSSIKIIRYKQNVSKNRSRGLFDQGLSCSVNALSVIIHFST